MKVNKKMIVEIKVTPVNNGGYVVKTFNAEADQRVAEADGEAKAIAIQSQAIQQNGGAAYIQLKAIEKWDGHYPTTMLGGNSIPLIQLGK